MNTLRTVLKVVVMASLVLAGNAFADENNKDGYWLDSSGVVVRNSYKECWKAGYWTSAMAIKECDADLVKAPEPKKAEAKAPVAAPALVPAAVAPKKTSFTLQAEALFDFDKSALRADGRQKLDDEVVGKIKEHAQVDTILVTGHADRIGTESYNQGLSQRRADAVKNYLVERGIESRRVETAAKGESEPVVACTNVRGSKLIECLQPNRRVVVEVKAQK